MLPGAASGMSSSDVDVICSGLQVGQVGIQPRDWLLKGLRMEEKTHTYGFLAL